MEAHHIRQHSPGNARILVVGLHLLTLILLALPLYMRTLPPTPTPIPETNSAEARWWGLWSFTFLPANVLYAAIFVIVGTILLFWLLELEILPVAQNWPGLAPSAVLRTLLVGTVLIFVSFYLFPIVHTRWGDAYILSRSISWPDPELRLTHSWQAPLDVYLHSRVWLLLGNTVGWDDATPVYRWLSPLAGALYLATLLRLSRKTWRASLWLPYGLLATLGVMQLFYGYIENYSFAAAGILIYLWLALATLHGKARLWQASFALAVTNATHPSTIILAPSLLYLAWQHAQNSARSANYSPLAYVLRVTLVQVILPMTFVALATIGLMEAGGHGINALLTTDRPGGGDARWFVPLWQTTTRWEHYTMFSWLHLRDFLNQQLLVAPVVWTSILITVLYRSTWLNTQRRTLDGQFLWIAAASYLLFIFVWNPDYGGQRDWDLFSLASIPAALLCAHLLSRTFIPTLVADNSNRVERNKINLRPLIHSALPLILVQGLYLISWIHQNTLPWDWP